MPLTHGDGQSKIRQTEQVKDSSTNWECETQLVPLRLKFKKSEFTAV